MTGDDYFLLWACSVFGVLVTAAWCGGVETGRKLGWTEREQELQKQHNREGAQ